MEITIYAKPGCYACEATKMAMDRAGLNYDVIDVTFNQPARELLSEHGFTKLPVIEVEEGGSVRYWHGFRPDLIKGLTK